MGLTKTGTRWESLVLLVWIWIAPTKSGSVIRAFVEDISRIKRPKTDEESVYKTKHSSLWFRCNNFSMDSLWASQVKTIVANFTGEFRELPLTIFDTFLHKSLSPLSGFVSMEVPRTQRFDIFWRYQNKAHLRESSNIRFSRQLNHWTDLKKKCTLFQKAY